MRWKGVAGEGLQALLTFSSHRPQSFLLPSTKYSYTLCRGGNCASTSRTNRSKRPREASSSVAPTLQTVQKVALSSSMRM